MSDRPPLITVAVLGAAHGIRGEMRVKTYLEDPEALGAYGPLTTEDGRELHVADLRVVKADLVVARFDEVKDRTTAEQLTGLTLKVPRAALPALADADTFYHADLIGLRAETPLGDLIGTVSALYAFGAGDMIEIRGARGSKIYPFTRAVVPVIDVAGGRVVIEPPAETEVVPT